MIVLTVKNPCPNPETRYVAKALRDGNTALCDAHGDGADPYSAVVALAESLHRTVVQLRAQTT